MMNRFNNCKTVTGLKRAATRARNANPGCAAVLYEIERDYSARLAELNAAAEPAAAIAQEAEPAAVAIAVEPAAEPEQEQEAAPEQITIAESPAAEPDEPAQEDTAESGRAMSRFLGRKLLRFPKAEQEATAEPEQPEPIPEPVPAQETPAAEPAPAQETAADRLANASKTVLEFIRANENNYKTPAGFMARMLSDMLLNRKKLMAAYSDEYTAAAAEAARNGDTNAVIHNGISANCFTALNAGLLLGALAYMQNTYNAPQEVTAALAILYTHEYRRVTKTHKAAQNAAARLSVEAANR